MGNLFYINHSGKYIEINYNVRIPFLHPTQTATYLGIVIMSHSLRAFPSPARVLTLLTQITEFLSYKWQNVVAC